MKKIIRTALVIVLVGGFGYMIYATLPQQSTQSGTSQIQPTPPPSQPQITEVPPTKTPGSYQPYTAEAVSSTKGTRILFFHAPWCSQCRQLDSDISATGVPDDVTIFKVDYDKNQTLRKQYQVTLQTTFVVLNDDGSLRKRHVAYDEPTFAAVKRAIL